MRYEMEKASIEKCTILRLNEEQVKLMSEPMGVNPFGLT
jgi:hypothetical protein